ncbi:hypothetical protein GCM10020000_54520 [Streptomyces olivoverticillatus]
MAGALVEGSRRGAADGLVARTGVVAAALEEQHAARHDRADQDECPGRDGYRLALAAALRRDRRRIQRGYSRHAGLPGPGPVAVSLALALDRLGIGVGLLGRRPVGAWLLPVRARLVVAHRVPAFSAPRNERRGSDDRSPTSLPIIRRLRAAGRRPGPESVRELSPPPRRIPPVTENTQQSPDRGPMDSAPRTADPVRARPR